jgi:hypothetical protein
MQVVICYTWPSNHGALLIANESDDIQFLVAINASEEKIYEVVGFMAEAISTHEQSGIGIHINYVYCLKFH